MRGVARISTVTALVATLASPLALAVLLVLVTPAGADEGAYGRWEQAHRERLDAARDADRAYGERSQASKEHEKAQRDLEKAQKDVDAAREVVERFLRGENKDALRDAVDQRRAAEERLREAEERAGAAKDRYEDAQKDYEAKDDRLAEKEQAEATRERELEEARARAASGGAPQAPAPPASAPAPPGIAGPVAGAPAGPTLSASNLDEVRGELERAEAGRTRGRDQLGQVGLFRLANAPGGPSAQDRQEATARFDAGLATLESALGSAAAVGDLFEQAGPANPELAALVRQAQVLADKIADDIRSAKYKWHQFWTEHGAEKQDAPPQAQAPDPGPAATADGSAPQTPSAPPRSPEELVAAHPSGGASSGAGPGGGQPATPLTSPVVQFLTPGLQPLTEVNKYQPFFVQVTLPSGPDARTGPISVTLNTPHLLWRGRHVLKLEQRSESGGVVTYRSQLQYWDKPTGFANPFADVPDALDNLTSYLPFFTDDPDWAEEPALYQVLAISNGETLRATFDGSTAGITVYDTWAQQGIANTEHAFGAARQFYTWLGDQLEGLSGGAVVDPNWLQQAKGAFPPGLVPWELTVLGQGGEISAEQITQLRASVQQKLTFLPQVQASWMALPEGNDIQRHFVGFGLFRTLIGDPATWTVYTGTGYLAQPTYSMPLLDPLPNGFNLAVSAAVRDAEDANRQGAQSALVDTTLAGYGAFAAVSGGGSLWTLASTGVASFEASTAQGFDPTFVRGTTAMGQTASNWDLFTSTVQVFAEPVVGVYASSRIGPTIAEGKRAVGESQANLAARSTQRSYQAYGMAGGRLGLGPSGRNVAGSAFVRSLDGAQGRSIVRRIPDVEPGAYVSRFRGEEFTPGDADFFLDNGLVPNWSITVDGKKFAVTPMFSGPDGRRTRLAFIETPDGGRQVVPWYLSNSENTWRAALGGEQGGYIMKGAKTNTTLNERTADLAAPIQAELHARNGEPVLTLPADVAARAFYGRLPHMTMLPTPQGSYTTTVPGFTDPSAVTIPLTRPDGTIPDGLLPNTSAGPTISWPIYANDPYYGRGMGFAFPSKDGTGVIIYNVTPQGAWTQGIYRADAGLTLQGTYRNVFQYSGSTPVRYTRGGEVATVGRDYVLDPSYVATDPLLPYSSSPPALEAGGVETLPGTFTFIRPLFPAEASYGTPGSSMLVGFPVRARPFSTLATYGLAGSVLFSPGPTILEVAGVSPDQASVLGADPRVLYVEPPLGKRAERGRR
jgi:hypothetical protein